MTCLSMPRKARCALMWPPFARGSCMFILLDSTRSRFSCTSHLRLPFLRVQGGGSHPRFGCTSAPTVARPNVYDELVRKHGALGVSLCVSLWAREAAGRRPPRGPTARVAQPAWGSGHVWCSADPSAPPHLSPPTRSIPAACMRMATSKRNSRHSLAPLAAAHPPPHTYTPCRLTMTAGASG